MLDEVRLVEADVAGLGPEIVEVGGVLLEQRAGHRGPEPHLAEGLADHVLVAAREALPVQAGQLLALVGGQPDEGVAMPAGRHGVGDLVGLLAEQALAVEHRGERHHLCALDLLGAAVLHDRSAAHERQRAVPRVGRVLQAQRGPPSAARASPDIGVVRRLAVDLRGDELGQSGRLGAGAVPVERRVVAPSGVEVVTDVALVGLHHAAAEAGAHPQPAKEIRHEVVAEGVLVATVSALERLQDPSAVLSVGREPERPASSGVREPTVDVAVRDRFRSLFVDVHVRHPEEPVRRHVPGNVNRAVPDLRTLTSLGH